MIDLTPLEVRKKKGDFRRTIRGYDPQLVDDFLDMTADRLEELVRENMTLTERSGRLEERVADYREREKALTEALVSAQEFRQERLNEASREAELRIREAEADAQHIRDSALREREREDEALRRVRARRSQLVESFRAFLERELQKLHVETAALDLADAAGADAAMEASARAREMGGNGAPAPAPPPPAARVARAARPPAAPAPVARPAPVAQPARLEPSVEPPFRLDPEPRPGDESSVEPPFRLDAEPEPGAEPPADEGPPITGDEDWLPLLEDEK